MFILTAIIWDVVSSKTGPFIVKSTFITYLSGFIKDGSCSLLALSDCVRFITFSSIEKKPLYRKR